MNASTLAESSGLSVETVTGILAAVRDEIVDLVLVKKNNVTLNLGFGILNLRQGGTVEFKSNTATMMASPEHDKLPVSQEHDKFTSADKKTTQSAFSQKRQSETVSRQTNAERNLNFMQQRQASQQSRADVRSAKSLGGNRDLNK